MTEAEMAAAIATIEGLGYGAQAPKDDEDAVEAARRALSTQLTDGKQ